MPIVAPVDFTPSTSYRVVAASIAEPTPPLKHSYLGVFALSGNARLKQAAPPGSSSSYAPVRAA
jgi:hypothetical protein